MELKWYLDKVSNIVAENRLLKTCIFLLMCGYAYNSYQVSQALKYQRVVLMPVGAPDSKMMISGDWLSEDYLRGIAHDVSYLALTYHPLSVKHQFETLLTMYAPEKFEEARTSFYALKDKVETAKISSAFYLYGLAVNKEKSEIEMRGMRQIFREGNLVESGSKTYVVSYKVADGRFQILKIYEKAS